MMFPCELQVNTVCYWFVYFDYSRYFQPSKVIYSNSVFHEQKKHIIFENLCQSIEYSFISNSVFCFFSEMLFYSWISNLIFSSSLWLRLNRQLKVFLSLSSACDDASWEILHSSYNLTSTLASVIHHHSATPGEPLVLQVSQSLLVSVFSADTDDVSVIFLEDFFLIDFVCIFKCLQVLQKLTYNTRIFQSTNHIQELIAFLMSNM